MVIRIRRERGLITVAASEMIEPSVESKLQMIGWLASDVMRKLSAPEIELVFDAREHEDPHD